MQTPYPEKNEREEEEGGKLKVGVNPVKSMPHFLCRRVCVVLCWACGWLRVNVGPVKSKPHYLCMGWRR